MTTAEQTTTIMTPPRRRGKSLIAGSGLEFWRSPIAFMEQLLVDYPDIVRLRMGIEHIHMINSPELAKPVLQRTNKNYVGFPMVVKSIKSVGGDNLFTSQGDEWRQQRKLLQPSFHKRAVTGFASLMLEEAQRYISDWNHGVTEPVSIANAAQDITFNIFARSLFSTNLAGEQSLRDDYAMGANYITYRIENPLAPPLFIPTPGNLKIQAAVKRVTNYLKAIVDARKQSDTPHDDFLQMLIETRYEDGAPLEETLLMNQAKMFLFGGNGPPAKIITWALYYLAKHPEVEAKLHVELDAVLYDREITLEDLPKLTYLQMIIDELLRLYPTAWALPRQCVDGDELGGYEIPKRSGVWVLLYTLHRHPDYWQKPDQFDPERFSADAVAKRPPHAYIPWGAGPRLCIANQISIIQMKLVLAMLCQRFRFTCPKDYKVSPKIGFPLGPDGPVMMTPVKRTKG